VGPGSRRPTGSSGWLGGSAAPAAAQGNDRFAAVAGEHPVGGALVAAVQGQAAGQAAHRPGAVAHVDLPSGTSGHDRPPSRGTNRTGMRSGGGRWWGGGGGGGSA